MNTANKNYQPFLNELDKLGFCTFSVFEDETIVRLKQLYAEHFENQEISGLYASHNSNPADKGLAISKAIKDIVLNPLQAIFPDYDYFLGHFMVKGAKVEKEFALHQDWNIVDESKYKSYQVWIPLQLTTPVNGGIFVVPGSHKFFNNHRSGSYGIPVVPNRDDIKHIYTNLNVPAGNILIYHNGLFHASHPNTTNTIRIAVIVNFVERKAPTYFFQKNIEKGCTDLYPITGDKLLSHLPDLEKGIIPPSFTKESEMPLSPIDNSTINYNNLRLHFHMAFYGSRAPQIKQLHITKNRFLENELNREGFTVLDLLSKEDVQLFSENYFSHFGNIEKTPGKFTTLQHTDVETKKKMHAFIVDHIQQPLENYFTDFSIPVSQYYTKKANTSGDIDLHADSTLLLNHQLEPHYAIWIPLVDVNEQNGCLTVIPKSHRFQHTIYGGSFPGCQNELREWLRQFEVPIRLKAGQAIVFDNNLLHNSTANTTDADRICFTFRMIHFSSDLYSFISNNKNTNNIDLYLETSNYYMDDQWDGEGRYLGGKFAGVMEQSIVSLKENDFLAIGIDEFNGAHG